MIKETVKEKQERIFNFYKKDLEKIGTKNDKNMRMNVIEYVCRFPKIDPYKMAAALASDGFQILFDDSSISQVENYKKRKAFEKLLK